MIPSVPYSFPRFTLRLPQIVDDRAVVACHSHQVSDLQSEQRITSSRFRGIRGTIDVDVISAIVTYADYVAFSERLHQALFTEDTDLTCRWHSVTLTLDVLGLNKAVLGFTNIWYGPALRYASAVSLPGGQTIRIITAPFFLGTKMEAFRGRGRMDFQASHDLEDFVAVIEGREAILQEIAESHRDLRDYLAEAAMGLLSESRFAISATALFPPEHFRKQPTFKLSARRSALNPRGHLKGSIWN